MRVQFDITNEKAAELNALLGVNTKRDLFENALAMPEWAAKTLKKEPHGIICSMDETNQTYKELVMPALNNVRSAALAKAKGEHNV